ncbi:hypothetical protein ACIO13_01320 [Streptomyces sp. NPDC087425]|uniref:hypothetical protein n=1 Tax=Streptomyces sp. NPDC087425 TaxID=3365787 RepID=UPI0038049A69
MIAGQSQTERLLPWTVNGKPAYVVGGGTGRISRMADHVECEQLEMAAELLEHADDLLAGEKVTSEQLRYLTGCLVNSLREVHRVAKSRGARIPGPEWGDDEDDEYDEGGEAGTGD